MLIRKAFKFRLEPTNAQAQLFERTGGCCRVVYNLALEQRKSAYSRLRKSVGYTRQANELPDLKEAFPWLGEIPSHCLQQSLRDLDTAFGNFFAGRAGYPKLRKKGEHDSFRFPDPKQIRIDGDRVVLPKAGPVKFRKSREIVGVLNS